ncbi:hypothetical protein I4U23_017863 [Adineta vaga]|nr:hypothetical protein I4U23_017863 [Adineta vaga]
MGNTPGGLIHRLKYRITGKRSSKSSCSSELPSPMDTINLETFLLVWLDPNVDSSKENLHTQKRLREILTCLITFDNVNACEKWLKKCYSDEKIILIVSGSYGQEIVPRIHYLSNIVSIHIYCLDVHRNQLWTKDYPKIRSVQSSTDELLHDLSLNQTNLESVEDSKALNILKRQQQIYSFDPKTASFLSYQLFLEILISPLYLQYPATYNELIQILRQYNSDNEYGSELIKEFERTYKSTNAIQWLIRDTPLVRFLNKALREQDIQMMFALRFLLIDVHKQIIEHQVSSLNVYKIQPMCRIDMENLKANPGQLLVMNGFLFASTNKSEVISMSTTNDQFENVLLDIQADYQSDAAPFTFLPNMESNHNKSMNREVLFMCGSIFEVGPLLNEELFWTLHLKLVGESKSLALSHMKQTLRETQDLCLVGDLFYQCEQIQQAAMYSKRLLSDLPKRHQLIPKINEQLTKYSQNNPISNQNVLYILVNLSDHLNEFTSSVLRILRLMTSKLILTIDDESPIDFSQWSKSNISIFTTTHYASSLECIPRNCQLFIFDKDNSKTDQQRYATIDDLICQLAEEIIQKFRSDAVKSTNIGDTTKAAEQNANAEQIYSELRKLQPTPDQTKTSDTFIAPSLIWLINDTTNDEITDLIEKQFPDYFQTHLTFYQEDDFHYYLLTNDIHADKFLILYGNYSKSMIESSRQFSNVKYVYQYEELNKTDKDKLQYRLTYDLIDYYGKLGEQYRANKQQKKAKLMFSKAKNLCHFLSKQYFSDE